MAEKIDVLMISPCSGPRKVQIDNTLEAKQVAVGGYIEVVHPFADSKIVLIVNEDGKLLGLEPNRGITYPNDAKDIVVGTFIVCRDAGEDFASLSAQEMSQYAEIFKSPEVLVKLGDDYHMMNPYTLGEKTYCLYQVKRGDEYRDYSFVGLDELEKAGRSVDPNDYDFVYSGPLRGKNLSELYEMFNLNHPSDFRGHSMSVSDVVVISDGKIETAHYVDRVGFAKLASFTTPESPKPARSKKKSKNKPPRSKGGDSR